MFQQEREAIDGPALNYELSALLAPNTTQFEYDLVASCARVTNIDYALSTKLDPATCDIETLKFVAWGRSTNLWDDDWTDLRKRSITVNSYYLHRLKGTVAGAREHLRYTDTTLQKVVAPPVNCFTSRNYTKAERDAFLAVMPQLRLYRFLEQGDKRGKMFCTKKPVRQRLYGGREDRTGWSYRAMMQLTDAEVRIGTRAFYWDRGSQYPLTTAVLNRTDVTGSAVNTITVKTPGKGGKAIFLSKGRTLSKGRNILDGEQAAGTTYTMVVDDTYVHPESTLHLGTVQPGLTPVNATFEYVQETSTEQFGSIMPGATRVNTRSKQILHRKFLPPSTARQRLYQRMYLLDPTRGVGLRQARSFLGNIRLGIAPFTAELSVEIINKRLRNSANDFVRGFLHKTDPKKVSMALRAIRVSKAARDKTLMRLGLYQIPRLSKGLPLDTGYHFGDRVKDY